MAIQATWRSWSSTTTGRPPTTMYASPIVSTLYTSYSSIHASKQLKTQCIILKQQYFRATTKQSIKELYCKRSHKLEMTTALTKPKSHEPVYSQVFHRNNIDCMGQDSDSHAG